MRIECILKRKDGTKVELGGTEYHFKPEADGRHIADVTNEAHLARFLSIPEAYKIALPGKTPAPVAAPIPAPTVQVETKQAAEQSQEQGEQSQGGASSEESDDGEQVTDTSELRKILAQQYKDKYGRMPHGKWDAAKIESELLKGAQ